MPSPSISSRQKWSRYSQPYVLKPCSRLFGGPKTYTRVQVSKPPVRRVVVARSCKEGGCNWEVVGNVSADSLVFVDTGATHPPENLQYRVATWSTYGRYVGGPLNALYMHSATTMFILKRGRCQSGRFPRRKSCEHICV